MIEPLLIGGALLSALYASVLQAAPGPATPDQPMRAGEAPAAGQEQMPVTPQPLIVEMRPASETPMDEAVDAAPEFGRMPMPLVDTLAPRARFRPAPLYPRWAPSPYGHTAPPPYGGWNNGWGPWGNRWAPVGGDWNNGYGGGDGWGDGYGDAAGDVDFSFAMRARVNADMRGSGYGDGYGYGRGYSHGYQGYPYLPYPPPFAPMPMPMPAESEGPQD